MTEQPHRSGRQQIHHGAAADQRLRQLGLAADIMLGAARAGDLGRQECTVLHPRQSAGHRMWSDTTAALRGGCMALQAGWRPDRANNFETVVHPDRGIAIAVAGGDEFTGWRGTKDPRVNRKRGPMTIQRVNDNFRGMEPLFALSGPTHVAGAERTTPWTTWFFLIRATPEELWLELSQPIGLDRAGYVSEWTERILLPTLPVQGGVTPLPDDDDDDEEPFTVRRK